MSVEKVLQDKAEWSVEVGDCLDVLKTLPNNSVDSVISDPPYALSKEPNIAEVMSHWINGTKYEHGSAGFMGKKWDSFIAGPEYWKEVYRVMKPGAHLLCFSSSRTWDLQSIAIRFAGFENRDTISIEGPPALRWYQGQGFPKSHDVSKALDAMAGAEREVVHQGPELTTGDTYGDNINAGFQQRTITKPTTKEAKEWEGWGTALKPAWEVVLVFRKPFDGTVAENILKHGTGGLNIDASRVESSGEHKRPFQPHNSGVEHDVYGKEGLKKSFMPTNAEGRFPANLILQHNPDCVEVGTKTAGSGKAKPNTERTRIGFRHGKQGESLKHGPSNAPDNYGTEIVAAWECTDGCPVKELDKQSGILKSGAEGPAGLNRGEAENWSGGWEGESVKGACYGDSGGASRFFYCSKAPANEKWFHCKTCSVTEKIANKSKHKDHEIVVHPTQKPLKLMAYLVKLVTPKHGVVLDPFSGSGSTGVAAVQNAFRFIGIEREEVYATLAKTRIAPPSDVYTLFE